MEFNWVDGFRISVDFVGEAVVISANKEGLLSLANHLTALAEEEHGDHFHLDEYNSLEHGSLELVVDRIEP